MWNYEVINSGDDYLAHHGILGMKWGVRRYQNEDGSLTPAGKKRYEQMDIIQSKKTGENLYVAKKRNRSHNDSERSYDIIRNGKKIGDLYMEDQGDTLYLNWISVKKTERGKGYADSVLDYAVNYSDNHGYKQMTLEVPGNSPDARHIYEKHNFKVDNSKKLSTDDVWGGLTSMKRKKGH